MYELSVSDEFCASHMLRGYEGKCKNLHGHTWKVEVVLQGRNLDAIGMVVDFRVVKGKLKEFLETLDHRHLNDLAYFKDVNPTTENLARYIFDEFSKACHPWKLSRVRVFESERTGITYSP